MRKAQESINLNTILISMFIVAIIIIFGFYALKNVGKAKCGADMSLYESSLKSFAENRDLGERASFNAAMPCEATYAFAIDVKKRDQVKESFYDIPFLKMRIENDNNNFYTINDKEVISAINIADLDVPYPYYECYRLNSGRLSLSVEGKGYNKEFSQTDPRYDCTFDKPYSVKMDDEDTNKEKEIIKDACPSCDTTDNPCIKPNRTITQQDGKIIVTIDLSCESGLGTFDYYEDLPKCVADGIVNKINLVLSGIGTQFTIDNTRTMRDAAGNALSVFSYTSSTIPPFNIQIIKPDPIMVWHFTNPTGNEEKIIYELNNLQKQVESDCLRQFRGVVTQTNNVDSDGDGIPDISDTIGGALGVACTAGGTCPFGGTNCNCISGYICISRYCRGNGCNNDFNPSGSCGTDPANCGKCIGDPTATSASDCASGNFDSMSGCIA